MRTKNKKKIINDPIYGFINIPLDEVHDIVDHPFFQRLRRIKQLGLTHLVYPGAMHTRFQHALGAMHLMIKALDLLKVKGLEITDEEYDAAVMAILLHDIGHGPFSHALENSIVQSTSHEQLSILFMQELNRQFDGKLDLAIEIFTGRYEKHFLHQLVSSQLDVDRLDYLKRDSFFTGVSEGVVGSDRIINMLNVSHGELVVEEKGIFSIEKFLFARRFMYWQVYLHKTVVSAESLLLLALKRARDLSRQGIELAGTPPLRYFLKHEVKPEEFLSREPVFKNLSRLEMFALLDDNDIVAALKEWSFHEDKLLAFLSFSIFNRNLFNIIIQQEEFTSDFIIRIKENLVKKFGYTQNDLEYLIYHDSLTNLAYSSEDSKIKILKQNGTLEDISQSSDIIHPQNLSSRNRKFFIIFPRE